MEGKNEMDKYQALAKRVGRTVLGFTDPDEPGQYRLYFEAPLSLELLKAVDTVFDAADVYVSADTDRRFSGPTWPEFEVVVVL